MKRNSFVSVFAIGLLAAIFLVACGQAAAPVPIDAPTAAPQGMSDEEMITVAQAYITAVWAHDFDTAASYLADDAVTVDATKLTVSFEAGLVQGKDAIVAFWNSDANPIFGTIETKNFVVKDGWVLYDYKITQGTSLGARGSALSNSAGVIILNADGKVIFDGDQPTALLWTSKQ